MTRWLQAARQATADETQPTEPTNSGQWANGGEGKTAYGGVLSVLSVLSGGESADPARAAGLDQDARTYLDRLRLHGPASYGAMATTLGWGATRAWRAEAKLRAAGLVMYRQGKAELTESGAV